MDRANDLQKRSPPLKRKSRAREINQLSREYLEAALHQARQYLPKRLYAQLHQAAMSSAGGRRRKNPTVNSVHVPSALEEMSVFKAADHLENREVALLVEFAKELIHHESRTATYSPEVEGYIDRLHEIAKSRGMDAPVGISQMPSDDLKQEIEHVEETIKIRKTGLAATGAATNRLDRLNQELKARAGESEEVVSKEESFTPPEAVQSAARRALEVRTDKPPSQRGMTATGIARARDLANGRPVSLGTIRRMVSFFDRHEVDKKGATWDEKGKGWQAWHGWGGDAGRRWAERILRREDKTEKGFHFGTADGGSHAHALNRSAQKTFNDGAHTHVFKIPGSGVYVYTEEDGSHEHALSDKTADSTETDGAHSHRLILSGDLVLMTTVGGAHDHSLMIETSNFSGTHTHKLTLPDGTEIESMTVGEYLRSMDMAPNAVESMEPAGRFADSLNVIESLRSQIREMIFEPPPGDEEILVQVARGEEKEIADQPVPMTVVAQMGKSTFEVEFSDGSPVLVESEPGLSVEVGDTVLVDDTIIDFAFGYKPITLEKARELESRTQQARRVGRTVPQHGPSDAVVVFVAERPSALEHARALPFAGPDGRTFVDRYLDPIGKGLSDVRCGFVVPTVLDYSGLSQSTQDFCKAAFLATVPDGALLIGVGKGVRDILGDQLDFWLPHPAAIRKNKDSGELDRKLRQIKQALDAIEKKSQSEKARSVNAGPAESSGEPRETSTVSVVKSLPEKRIVYGVVLDPYQVDLQNDWLPPAEIERTAHEFMKSSRVIGFEHKERARGAQVVESFIELYPSTDDRENAFKGLPHTATRRPFGNDVLHSGAWVLGVQLDDALWRKHQAGEIDAFSIGGFSVRSQTDTQPAEGVTFIDLKGE